MVEKARAEFIIHLRGTETINCNVELESDRSCEQLTVRVHLKGGEVSEHKLEHPRVPLAKFAQTLEQEYVIHSEIEGRYKLQTFVKAV